MIRGRPILFITRMITDRIGLHSVLLPLFIDILSLLVVYSSGGGDGGVCDDCFVGFSSSCRRLIYLKWLINGLGLENLTFSSDARKNVTVETHLYVRGE